MSMRDILESAARSVDNMFNLSNRAEEQVVARQRLDTQRYERDAWLLEEYRRLCGEFKTCRANVDELTQYREEAEYWKREAERRNAQLESVTRDSASLTEDMLPIVTSLRDKAIQAEQNMLDAINKHDALLNDARAHEDELNLAIAAFDEECKASGNRAAQTALQDQVTEVNASYTDDIDAAPRPRRKRARAP